jgi:hypothetical protein
LKHTHASANPYKAFKFLPSTKALTFPAGLGRKQGDLLFYLLAFAFRTCGFAFVMFTETLYQ